MILAKVISQMTLARIRFKLGDFWIVYDTKKAILHQIASKIESDV